jgi:hypothetical protein
MVAWHRVSEESATSILRQDNMAAVTNNKMDSRNVYKILCGKVS